MTAGTIRCPGGSSRRAPATSAGSPSRRSPSSTCTRSTTGARATPQQVSPLDQLGRAPARDPPLEELRPQHLDSVREASKSSEPYGTAFVPSVFHRFNPFWPDPEPFLSEYHGTLRISRAGPLPVLHVEPGLQLPADRRQDRRGGSRLARSGSRRPAQGRGQPVVGNARVPVRSRGLRRRRLHGGRLAAAGLGQARADPSGRVRRRDHRRHTRPSAVKLPANSLVEIAGRGAPGRQRLAAGPRPVPHGQPLDGIPAQGCTGTSATARPARLTDPLHIYLRPGLYTVTHEGSRANAESLAIVNRVPVHRALVFADEKHPADQLAPYLTILDRYNPAKLDAAGLLQLVRAFDQAGLSPPGRQGRPGGNAGRTRAHRFRERLRRRAAGRRLAPRSAR